VFTPKISAQLKKQLEDLRESSNNKSRLLDPDEIENSALLAMSEHLLRITDSLSPSDEKSKDLYSQYYSVCLRGVNPFKDPVIRKAGIDPLNWRRLLKQVSGDFLK